MATILDFLFEHPTIGGIIVLAIPAAIYVAVTSLIAGRKRKSGKDKEALHNMAAKVLGDTSSYTIVFATYTEREGTLKAHMAYYYYYCLAFREWEIVVIPIKSIEKDLIFPGESWVINEQTIATTKKVLGATMIYDKDGKEINKWSVDPETDNTDKLACPLAIEQNDEAKKYYGFIEAIAQRIQ